MKIRSIAIVLVLLFSMGTSFSTPRVAAGQVVVKLAEPQYTLIKYQRPAQLNRGDEPCEYFMRTLNYTTSEHIDFFYVNESHRQTDDVPAFDHIRIVIEPDKAIPTATKTINGSDLDGRDTWRLGMSQATYDANQKCLQGIEIVKSTK